MEDPAILKMNLERFRRLLQSEADPAKRQTIEELTRRTKNNLKYHQISRSPPQGVFASGERVK